MGDETSISTRAKETKSKPWTGKMGKKKENIKLPDLEPSKDAKGGRATHAGLTSADILKEGGEPKPYYFGTLREPPPTAKQVTRELWDSLVILGRHRKIPSDENILLLLPSCLKRYEDAPKRMVALVKAEWDQLQRLPMLPHPVDWSEEGSGEPDGNTTTHRFRALYRTASVSWSDGRRITGPNGEDVLCMPDGAVVYPIPDLRVEVDLGGDNEPHSFRVHNEWRPILVARHQR
jgi:hypothetical protein